MSEGKCHNCGEEIGQSDYGVPFMEQVAYEKGRADAIRELTEWRTGEPPEGVDRVLVNDTDYVTYTVMHRDSGELWSIGVGSIPWKKRFLWLPIPQ